MVLTIAKIFQAAAASVTLVYSFLPTGSRQIKPNNAGRLNDFLVNGPHPLREDMEEDRTHVFHFQIRGLPLYDAFAHPLPPARERAKPSASEDPDFMFFYEHGYLVEDYHDDPNIAYRSCERDMQRVLGPIHSKRLALMLPRGDLDAKDPFLGKKERFANKEPSKLVTVQPHEWQNVNRQKNYAESFTNTWRKFCNILVSNSLQENVILGISSEAEREEHVSNTCEVSSKWFKVYLKNHVHIKENERPDRKALQTYCQWLRLRHHNFVRILEKRNFLRNYDCKAIKAQPTSQVAAEGNQARMPEVAHKKKNIPQGKKVSNHVTEGKKALKKTNAKGAKAKKMRFRSARADSGASNTTTEEPVETFDIDDQLETTEPELVEEDLGNDLEETTAFPEELTTQEEETSQEEETTLEEELEEETTTSEEEPELNTTTLPKLPGTTTLPDIIPATTSAPRRRKLTTLPDIIPLTTSLPPVVNTTVRRKKRPAKTTLADIVPALNINVTITTTTPKIKTKKKVKLKTTVTKKVTTVAIGPTTVATSAPVINLANKNLPCNGVGICSDDGLCLCNSTHTGVDCGTAVCEGGCGLHGFCLDGTCECFPGWHGTYCNYVDCKRDILDHPTTCSGHGACAGGDNEDRQCFCLHGFTGRDCERKLCPLAHGETGEVQECSGRGACTDQGTCQCVRGFVGPACHDCDPKTSRTVCPPGKDCFCEKGYHGTCCDKKDCPNQCSGHGLCAGTEGVCDCMYGFTGKDCSVQAACPSNQKTSEACSGVGACKPDNTGELQHHQCICPISKTGLACEHDLCPFNNCFNEKRGMCVKGSCVCNPGYGGIGCQEQLHIPTRCAQSCNNECLSMPDCLTPVSSNSAANQEQPPSIQNALRGYEGDGDYQEMLETGAKLQSSKQFSCFYKCLIDCSEKKCFSGSNSVI